MVLGKSLYFLLAVLAVHLITAHRPGGRPGGPGGPGRDDGDDGQDRYRRQIVRCNYTETPGKTCLSCNQTLACYRLNLGIVRNCGRREPHCNQGKCSTTSSDSCNSTSTQ